MLLPALLGTGLPAAVGAQPEQDPQKLKQAIEALRKRQQEIRGERDQLSRDLAATERRIGEVARRLRELEAERDRTRQRLEGLERQRRGLEEEVRKLRRELAALVRGAYLSGREERLRLLLDQEDPSRVSRMLAYHDYLSAARVARIRELQERLRRLAGVVREIGERRQALDRLAAELEAERERLRSDRRERSRILARLEKELARGKERLRRMEEDARRLSRLVEESARALQSLRVPEEEPFSRCRGRLEWPLRGRLANAFGAEKIGNLRWDGVIIRAPEGREVKAVHGGRVAYADWLRGYGLLIIIDHGDGYMTLYGHNQSLFKETGDWVRQGEVIGLAGRSGGLRHSGIYFGIRHRGKPLDPARWCRRRTGRKAG